MWRTNTYFVPRFASYAWQVLMDEEADGRREKGGAAPLAAFPRWSLEPVSVRLGTEEPLGEHRGERRMDEVRGGEAGGIALLVLPRGNIKKPPLLL
jgi:hypothetical protein